jgi:hypothetical protein
MKARNGTEDCRWILKSKAEGLMAEVDRITIVQWTTKRFSSLVGEICCISDCMEISRSITEKW